MRKTRNEKTAARRSFCAVGAVGRSLRRGRRPRRPAGLPKHFRKGNGASGTPPPTIYRYIVGAKRCSAARCGHRALRSSIGTFRRAYLLIPPAGNRIGPARLETRTDAMAAVDGVVYIACQLHIMPPEMAACPAGLFLFHDMTSFLHSIAQKGQNKGKCHNFVAFAMRVG